MKRTLMSLLGVFVLFTLLTSESCGGTPQNNTALNEQAHTESNQANLLAVQPLPNITWSLERDNLTKRFKLQNDRTVSFFMYILIEGISQPIGYYQVNKVSSVNSQLSAVQQIVDDPYHTGTGSLVIESPAEDGSYGTNGNGVFGFTPEDIYIETNCKYISSTVPLTFREPVIRLAVITTEEAKSLLENSKKAMSK